MNGIRNTVKAAVATTAVAAAALAVAAPASAAPAQPAPGASYKGAVKGGKVTLKVKAKSRARLAYAVNSKCGRSRGTVTLKIKRGHFRSSRRSKSAAVTGKFVAGGKKAKGTLTPAAAKRSTTCKLGARRFTARLSASSAAAGLGDTGSSLSPSDYGHYAGANAAGRAVSFDVVKGSEIDTIENFAVDVDTECWGDYDHDGADDALLVHVNGFGDEIAEDGSFDIYYAPDEDTEFEFSGTIRNGQVAVDVTVGGHFNPDGTPNVLGAYECDSWGDTYNAARQG